MMKKIISALMIFGFSLATFSCSNEEKGEFVSLFYESSGGTTTSDLFVDNEGDVSIIIDNQLSLRQKNIVDNSVTYLGKPEEIISKINEEGFEKILWMNSRINYQQTGEDYLLYLVKNGTESDIHLLYMKNNEKIYSINITEITGSSYSAFSRGVKIIPCLDGNICYYKTSMNSSYEAVSRVYIINPLSGEVINSFRCDYVPKFIIEDELIGVSNDYDEILYTDILSGDISKEIDIDVNRNNDFMDITSFGKSIFLVNKKGIFKVGEDDKIECILSDSGTMYLDDSKVYEDLILEEESESVAEKLTSVNYLMHRIIAKSKNEFIVEVTIADSSGYSFAKCYIEYNLDY